MIWERHRELSCFCASGRSRGFVTPVRSYDASQPTILEYLTFHCASAMHMDDGWEIPEVSQEIDHNCISKTCSVYDVVAWDGRYTDMALALAFLA